MITRDPELFLAAAEQCRVDAAAALPRGLFLVEPEGFCIAEQSASDNLYMHLLEPVDPARAMAQHRGLHAALAQDRPAVVFPGLAATPDAVFPNNVFSTARVGGQGRAIIGHMRHPVRQAEAAREDLRGFFRDVLGYGMHDLSLRGGVCELTGSMVVDRSRGLGFCGLGERCDVAGATAMFEAFGLNAMLMFDLAPTEYHANVVMSVLAGRALVIAPDGFADPAVPAALARLYPSAVELCRDERQGFAGNCIAVAGQRVWMSERAADALAPASRASLERAGFAIGAVALDEIEKAGGSLRCCVGEIY